jgi:riboflavin synthase
VAVNGVCLTVVEALGSRLAFDAVPETLRRSNLGALSAGSRVNLERPLAANGRLSGHFVQGHVDGVGRIANVTPEGEGVRARIEAPPALTRYVVEKGSIAADGCSLTVAACGGEWFEVALIPHTLAVTILGGWNPGTTVNLEVDILAKYVEKLVQGGE